MQARGLLMIEHRLIERMIGVMESTLAQAKATGAIEPLFVDQAVDFIRTYADRTHHGKEEDILFKACDQKQLSSGDRGVMDRLTQEHTFGRDTTRALVDANRTYREGDDAALGEVLSKLEVLVEFYPRHIETEDGVFFPAAQAYFSDEEEEAMIEAFYVLDRRMIHERYRAVVEGLERPLRP